MDNIWIRLYELSSSLSIDLVYHKGTSDREYIALAYVSSNTDILKHKIGFFFHDEDSEELKLFTFAHEIGHILDYERNGRNNLEYRAREKLMNNKISELTNLEKESILLHEQKAWIYGKHKLLDCGLRSHDLISLYEKRMNQDLESYKSKMSL